MNSIRFWLNLLNVHRSEWPIVKKLFWLQFFQGAGISFFFTAEFARFLEKFPIHELPWVMVFSSGLLWLAGFAYTVLEHRISFKKFNEGIILLMAGSMLLVRVGSNIFTGDWFYFFSLSWFYVLYLLNNLEFWGIAARIFDIRQSKRLFGVISAGDIPAKFIGYTLALVFVPYTGTLNLLLLGVISMVISVPLFRSIAKAEKQHFTDPHATHAVHVSNHPIRSLYNTFSSNIIVRRIAVISLLASACILLVNYGFYAKVKEAYHDDVSLARFIAMFMAGLRIAALITKTIFTGRLTTSLGVQPSLFITPIVLLLLVVLTLVQNSMNPDEKMLFYFFGASSIAIDVLRAAINSPVLLTVMQPLPTQERLRAHNIVKGIMDPFATLFCGILLIILFRIQQEINLLTISYTLIILAVGWIIGIIFVNKEYLNMLVSTISSRYFSQEEFSLNDNLTLEKIKEKIQLGTDQEVLSILNMVGSKQNPLSTDLLRHFIAHKSDAIRLEAIRLISQKNIRQLKEPLEALLDKSQNKMITREAIAALCKLSESPALVSGYKSHPDKEIRNAALCGMLSNPHESIKKIAEDELGNLLSSEHIQDKETGLDILQEVRNEYDHPLHATIIRGELIPSLSRKAIDAIGKAATNDSLLALLSHLPKHEKPIISALLRAGSNSVPHIEQYLYQHHPSPALASQMILLLGKIGGNESRMVLERLVKTQPVSLPATIKALYRSKFKAPPATRAILEDLSRAYLRYGVEMLYMQMALKEKGQAAELLYNAVQIELAEIRELLLCLFGCLYDREKIRKSRNGLLANQRDTIANAMEIIEVTVRKDLSKYFNILFEDSGIEERCHALRSLFQEKEYNALDDIMKRILSERPILYQDWTKACSLYVSRKYRVAMDDVYFRKYIHSENQLLQETARYAMA
ncbi:hypothetical protein BC349_05015 [Flavihumibacter stibioxidans]|uniref:ADP,ATP carrier protein n=1 Tax=Flavihumibacter stibioxidans TaxID=1834163 RepID=A0ABR7M5P9_9BACT|nr:hypothetical protein [Flavihumibacter stibioxidans]